LGSFTVSNVVKTGVICQFENHRPKKLNVSTTCPPLCWLHKRILIRSVRPWAHWTTRRRKNKRGRPSQKKTPEKNPSQPWISNRQLSAASGTSL